MLALTEAGLLVGVKEPFVGHLENLILEIDAAVKFSIKSSLQLTARLVWMETHIVALLVTPPNRIH